jgi:membrane protease YdiL (CAAX protease family)
MPPAEQILRAGIPVIFGIAGAFLLDRMCAVRGFLPPGFHVLWRRLLAGAAVAGLLAVGVFAPLGNLGLSLEPDLSKITTPQLFLLHFLMLGALGAWFFLGYGGTGSVAVDAEGWAPPRPSLGQQFAAQLGFRTPGVWREIGLGIVLGISAWMAVILVLIAIAGLLLALGFKDAMPQQPPAMVPFIAGLPILIRLLISLSAGVVEETFFRGFLQPRIGIVLSTAFFALAHLSYGQPFMLVGITILSLIYAFLVKWRQNVWPAIAAHALFDGVQLLVIVPGVLRMIGTKAPALLASLLAQGTIW